MKKDVSKDYDEAVNIIANLTEFQKAFLHTKNYSMSGALLPGHVEPYDIKHMGGDVNRENFLSITVENYPHPSKLNAKEAVLWCAERGIKVNYTRVHDIGFRAGERDGYASERVEGGFEAVEYGVLGRADGKYPYGTKRTVLARFDVQSVA